MAEVIFNKLEKVYSNGFKAVHAIDLKIAEGEFMVIVGPSGCAKSTTLRMLAGLETISGGEVRIGDKIVNNLAPKERGIAMVFQNYALYPHMTVRENLAFGLKLSKLPKDQIESQVNEAAKILELEELLDRLPRQLSGGQAQRVAVGRAIVKKPDVFLFDEPLSNLDAKLREEARVFLRELIIKLGLSALMVTHDQNEAMSISDRILLLNNGKIEQQGTPQEMYGSPKTLFTAEFMGSNNRLHGKVTEVRDGKARIEGKGWVLWGQAGEGVRSGEDATAVIRVERVAVVEGPGENQLALPLLTSMYLGDRWEYLFRTPGDDFVIRAYGHEARDPLHCHLSLPEKHVWIFPKN